MSAADGRGAPPPVIPLAVNLASFNDILFILEKSLIVQKGQYVRDRFSLLYDE